jgi:DNA polymerase-3 subunit alpha
MKAAFIDGMIEHSQVERSFAEKFWVRMEAFADYGFNKVHSACYATIAYQTAYLKAHYPAAFMAALMTSDYDDTDRLAIEITECKHMGIPVLPPDVNESFVEFAVVPGQQQIRFGLNAIKNVGTAAVEEILRARGEAVFTGLEDFLSRVSSRVVNRKAIESLIKAGALDRFGERAVLLHNLDLLSAFASRLQKEANSGQTDIFGGQQHAALKHLKLELDAPAISSHEQLLWERELLGLYLSQHPLEAFATILSEKTVPLKSLTTEHDNRTVTIGGAITNVRTITTKNGQKMAFVRIEDQSGEVEAILFPNSFQQTADLWERDRIVLVRGKINARDRDGKQASEIKIMVSEANEITIEEATNYQPIGKKLRVPKARPAPQPVPMAEPEGEAAFALTEEPGGNNQPSPSERVYVRIMDTADEQMLLSLKQTIDSHQGGTEVVLVLGEAARRQAIRLPGGIDRESEGLTKLQTLVGADNLVIK